MKVKCPECEESVGVPTAVSVLRYGLIKIDPRGQILVPPHHGSKGANETLILSESGKVLQVVCVGTHCLPK